MTWAQRKGLLKAASNGGHISTKQGVRKDVINQLWIDGYLEATDDGWQMTEAGRAVIAPRS
jgi:hypothetical protein